MIISSINKSKNVDKLIILLYIILIITSKDTLLFGTNINRTAIWYGFMFQMIVLHVLTIYLLFEYYKLNYKSILIALLLMILIMVAGLNDNYFTLGYFYKMLLIIVSLLIASLKPISFFLVNYEKIVRVLALVSIVGYVSYLLFANLSALFPIVVNSGEMRFINLYVVMIPDYGFPGVLIRNWGIFREPGVFQIYLNMALLIQLFYLKKVSVKAVIIYIVAIITTYSTTGYFIMALMVMFYFFYKQYRWNKSKLSIIIFLIASITIIYTQFPTALSYGWHSVVSKLFDLSNESTTARISSFNVNFYIFASSPLIGVGINQVNELYPQISMLLNGIMSKDNANMIFKNFATFGFVYGMIWLVALWRFCENFGNSISVRIIAYLSFLIIFSFQDMSWSFLPYILLFYGVNMHNNLESYTEPSNSNCEVGKLNHCINM